MKDKTKVNLSKLYFEKYQKKIQASTPVAINKISYDGARQDFYTPSFK